MKFLPVAATFLFVLLQSSTNAESNDVERRIFDVENGLKKEIQIKGNDFSKMNILERMRFYNVPSLSIAIINNGKVEWAKTYNLHHNEPITTQTLFQAASISKSFTATLALSLVEKNKLTLDQNINEILRSWKVTDNQYTEKEKVTLRRLLSHTAGVNVHGFEGYSSLTDQIPTLTQILNGAPPANSPAIVVNNFPGKNLSYSGGGYLIVQKTIEDVTHKPFADLAQEIIFKPLGMQSSSFEIRWPSSSRFFAIGHLEDGKEDPGYWNIYPESAAAGLWTTPYELAQFVIEIQKSYTATSNKILSQPLIKEMLTLQGNKRFGLGLLIKQLNPKVLEFSHSGGNVGYQCHLVGFTHTNLGAVIMTNSDNAWLLMPEVTRSIADAYQWPSGYTGQYKVVEEVTIDPALYKNYEGEFIVDGIRKPSDPPFSLTLFVQNNHFYIRLPFPGINSENKTFELKPESGTTFFSESRDFEVIFSLGNDDEFTIMGFKAVRISKEVNQ